MTVHADDHYSITIHTPDEAVLNCLCALAAYSQKKGNTRITWGGTKRGDWIRDGKSVTFRFSDPDFRSAFLQKVNELLPRDLWAAISESDNDPANPRN